MYAAYAAKENRISAHCIAVYGSSSSIRPELTAIAMAYEDVRREEDLTILTDSLSCLVLLKSLQWRDFPLWIFRHPLRQPWVHTVRLINARAEAGGVKRFIKVKLYRGEPLRPFTSRTRLPRRVGPATTEPTGPSSGLALIGRLTRRRDGSSSPAHALLSTAWLLRPDPGWSTLGKVLLSMKTSACKIRVLLSSRHVPVQRHSVQMETSQLADVLALRDCKRVSSAHSV